MQAWNFDPSSRRGMVAVLTHWEGQEDGRRSFDQCGVHKVAAIHDLSAEVAPEFRKQNEP